MEQQTRDGLECARIAEVVPPELWIETGFPRGGAVLAVTADEEVKSAVIVVVEPDRAGGPGSHVEPGFGGYICKRAVAVVAIQNGAADTGYQHVRVTVVVVIAHSHAHAEVAAGDAGAFRDVSK